MLGKIIQQAFQKLMKFDCIGLEPVPLFYPVGRFPLTLPSNPCEACEAELRLYRKLLWRKKSPLRWTIAETERDVCCYRLLEIKQFLQKELYCKSEQCALETQAEPCELCSESFLTDLHGLVLSFNENKKSS